LENRAFLEEAVEDADPFGKYKGRLLIDLPEFYVAWFAEGLFPKEN